MKRLTDSMCWTLAAKACDAASGVKLADVIVVLAGTTSTLR